jgi:hypothetical protein
VQQRTKSAERCGESCSLSCQYLYFCSSKASTLVLVKQVSTYPPPKKKPCHSSCSTTRSANSKRCSTFVPVKHLYCCTSKASQLSTLPLLLLLHKLGKFGKIVTVAACVYVCMYEYIYIIYIFCAYCTRQ